MFEEKSLSPVPPPAQTPSTYLFLDALKLVSGGAKVSRAEWNNPEFYCSLQFSEAYQTRVLSLHKDDGKFHEWIISESDMLADDWVVLPEGN